MKNFFRFEFKKVFLAILLIPIGQFVFSFSVSLFYMLVSLFYGFDVRGMEIPTGCFNTQYGFPFDFLTTTLTCGSGTDFSPLALFSDLALGYLASCTLLFVLGRMKKRSLSTLGQSGGA